MESLEERTLLSINAGWEEQAPSWTPPVEPAWFEQLAPASESAVSIGGLSAEGPSGVGQMTWQNQVIDVVSSQWIVQLTPQAATQAGSVAGAAEVLDTDLFTTQVICGLGMQGMVLVETQRGVATETVTGWFDESPAVEYYEPNGIVAPAVLPNDPGLSSLWGMNNYGQTGGTAGADIDAPEAWDISTGSASIVVGVIDTGVDYTHPDLAANIWTNPGEIDGNGIDDDGNGFVDDIHGWDFYSDDSDPMDSTGDHGTHCAGTIAGVGNNNRGVVGVNWTSSIMALRYLGPWGGYTADAIQCVNYATMMNQRGVNVKLTSNSWGGGGYSVALENAIRASGNAGMLFIAAAGNNGMNNDAFPHYPSSYDVDTLIAVAASDDDDALAGFSHYGRTSVDLAAPGVQIYSTLPGNRYGYKNGTSMATPHVAGVAALAWSVSPGATAEEIRDAIYNGVDPIPSLTGLMTTGGRLNARNTLDQLVFNVLSSDPAPDAVVSAELLEFTIDLTHAYAPATVGPEDFTVNGQAADAVAFFDADTLTFQFHTTPIVAQGPQVMEVQAGSIERLGDQFPLRPWQEVFYYDLLPMAVVSTAPAEGAIVAAPPVEIVLDFNEAVDPASVDTGDLWLSSGRVIGATALDADTVAYTVDELPREGPMTYRLLEAELRDGYGNPNGGYEGHFYIDHPLIELYSPEPRLRLIVDESTIRSTIWIEDSFPIADLDVQLDIIHAYGSDLNVDLIAPDGTRLDLFTNVGGGGGSFTGTTLDDEASVPITAGVSPFAGRYRPEDALATLDGSDVFGLWTLEISDESYDNIGVLNYWSLLPERDVAADFMPRIVSADPLPAEGGFTRYDLDGMGIEFSEAMDPATVNDPGNWQLVGAGADGQFDTADDVPYTLSLVSEYESGMNVELQIDSGPLPVGDYRFTGVSGGLADRTDNPLDGDDDGTGGDDFVRHFSVLAVVDTFPFFEDFEVGDVDAFPSYWEFVTTAGGEVAVTGDGGPRDAYHLELTQTGAGGAGAILHLDLRDGPTSARNVSLDFWHKSDGLAGYHEGRVDVRQDDLSGWTTVLTLPTEPAEYTQYTIDLDPLVAAAGMSYSDDFQIRFYHDGFPGVGDDQVFYFDDVTVDWDGDGPAVAVHAMIGPAGWPITMSGISYTFDEEIDAGSFGLDDVVSFTGPNGDLMNRLLNVTGGGTDVTVRMHSLTAPGLYTMVIGPEILDLPGNLMDQDDDSLLGEVPDDRYVAEITIPTLPQIVGHVPEGTALGPVHAVRVHFDHAMDPDSFAPADDLTSFEGPAGSIVPTGTRWIDPYTLEMAFDPQWTPGVYEMVLGPQILDTAGRPLDQDGDLVPGEDPDDQYSFSFTLTSPGGPGPHALFPGELLPVADAPRDVAVGDLNRDGLLDLVTANQWDNSVSVLLGNGNGAFADQADYATGSQPYSVALGDLDGDGWLDVVTADKSGNSVSVLLNQGDATFTHRTAFDAGTEPWSVAIGDLDDDGALDLVTANHNSNTVSVLLGAGDGTFDAPVPYAAGLGPASVALGDLDGDDALDIVVANKYGDNVSVLLGNDDATFGIQQTYEVGNDPWDVALGDLDGDDALDLVAVNHLDDTVSVLVGAGDGTFTEAGTRRVSSAPRAVALGDLDGDGVLDVVDVNGGGDDVSVLLGYGDGTFAGQVPYDAGGGPWAVALGDLDGDGALDVVAANGGGDDVSILLGNGDGTLPQQILSVVGDRPSGASLADLSGDGLPDLLTVNWNDDTAALLLGDGEGNFIAQGTYDVGDGPYALALGDLDDNGTQDFVTANSQDSTVSVLLRNLDGSFRDQVTYEVGLSPHSVTLGDLDGDGLPDLVTANKLGYSVSVLLNTGGGSFAEKQTYGAGDHPASVALGYLDDDDALDIVTANLNGDNVSVLLGLGDGSFTAPTTYAVCDGPQSVALGDVNHDDATDIVTANASGGTISVLLGAGDGTFAPQVPYDVAYGATSVALGDLNGDGHPDVAATGAHQVTVLTGTGDGTFPRQAVYDAGASPGAVALGDLNADGRLDVVTANASDDNVAALLNVRKELWHAPSGAVGDAVDAVRFHFPQLMDTASFSLADDLVSFTGPGGDIAADGFAWLDEQTLEITFASQSALGAYTMVIGPEILNAAGYPLELDRDWIPGEGADDRYTAVFHLPPSLGVIDFLEIEGADLTTGDLWYSFQTMHPGFLTLEAMPAERTRTAGLALFDENLAMLATSAPAPGHQRIDWLTGAGATYYFRATGSSADVDLRLTNLVNHAGTEVTVYGTDGEDRFEFDASASRRITINGVSYHFDDAEVASVVFDGGAGADTAVFQGSDDSETVQMWPDHAELQAAGLLVTASSVESMTAGAGAGYDLALLHGSDGDDAFEAGPGTATLIGLDFSHTTTDFDQVHATAGVGGDDTARLHGSDGDDTYVGKPDFGELFGEGFLVRAELFAVVVADTGADGFDVARLYDSPDADKLVARLGQATFSGPTFSHEVSGFESLSAWATADGNDLAVLYDSPGNDTFLATPADAVFSGPGFYYRVTDFPAVTAVSNSGGFDLAKLYDSSGEDKFVGRPTYGKLRGEDFNNTAKHFDTVLGIARNGGTDKAYLFDSAGNDRFIGRPTYSVLRGTGFKHLAKFFEEVSARGSAGGYDRAYLFDSALDDLLEVGSNQATLSSNNTALDFLYSVVGFDYAWAKSTRGNDTLDIQQAPEFLLVLAGDWQ